ALAVCVYLALAPANPPIVRAGVMTLGFLAADALGRRYDRLNVLAWTACAVAVARPTDASSGGFQLSFLAVGGISVLAPRVRDGLLRVARVHEPSPDRRTRAQRAAHRAASALGTAIAAWAITAPLVALHAGMATPWAALASVVFAPLFSLLLCAGYATMLVSAVAPTLGAPLAWATGALAEWMLLAVHAAERAPFGAIYLPAIDWWWAALATVAIALV